MASIFDVDTAKLISELAEQFKKIEQIKPPTWATFCKTGAHKERPPLNSDWWYTRAASMLRKVAILGPIGVSKLRVHYGGKKNKGYKPEKFYKGSGNIARKILQQLEKAGLLKFAEKGVHKGRVVTPKGKSLLDKSAQKLLVQMPKPHYKNVEIRREEPKEASAPEIKRDLKPKRKESGVQAKQEKVIKAETKEQKEIPAHKEEPKEKSGPQKEEPVKGSPEKAEKVTEVKQEQ